MTRRARPFWSPRRCGLQFVLAQSPPRRRVASYTTRARFGFLGNNYSGMLDIYSDFTMLQGATGMHVELLEMCDLASRLVAVSDEDAARKLDEIKAMFEISKDSPSDPLSRLGPQGWCQRLVVLG